MDIRVISDVDALSDYTGAWDDLANAALEPNPFYEHWMLIPALRNFAAHKRIQVLLVFEARSDSRPPILSGVFPFEQSRRYMGIPLRALRLWKYNHCPLTTPLIRSDCADKVMRVVFDWLTSKDTSCDLAEMKYVPGEGPFNQLLVDRLRGLGSTPVVWEWFTRALFQPRGTPDEYFSVALSSKHRKAFRRRKEMLAEKGALEYTVAGSGADIGKWIDCFLRVESSGWKGKEGSAMACQEERRRFFVEVVTKAFEKNRLLMPALTVGGKVIAQNCYFVSGSGSFHFKPAFDEEYASFSPGFHMECELIRYLHSQPDIKWMDSCTTSDNDMYNRLFLSRRTIQSIVTPLRGRASDVAVSSIPLLKALRGAVRSLLNRKPSWQKDRQGEPAEVKAAVVQTARTVDSWSIRELQ